MLDIEPGQSDDEGLLAIVDRLGTAGSDRAAARAHEQVRRAVSAGVPLPGLRFLATPWPRSVRARSPHPRATPRTSPARWSRRSATTRS